MTSLDVTPAFAALGDPTRRAIFEALVNGPRSVGDLASRFPVSRPAVSQHLRVLKDAHLVTDRREGVRAYYSVDMTGVEGMRAYFERFWPHVLAAFKRVVEEEEK